MIPTGKGFVIWQLKLVHGGDPEMIADAAVAAGVTHVWIKVADGVARYNLRSTPLGWVDDLVQPVVDALHARGILVIGWHYIYLTDPVREAALAVDRVMHYGLDGYVSNPEGYAKHKFSQAKTYADWLVPLKEMGIPIGLCSYRYPSYHLELPWAQLLREADYHAPQVYWMFNDNPGEQLEKSAAELLAMKDLPIVPMGAAFSEFGWTPKKTELDELDAKAQEMGSPGIVWYRWGHAIEYGFVETITAHEWAVDQPEPPEPPEPPPDEDEVLEIVEVTGQPYLNIRTDPRADAEDVGNLLPGSVVPIVAIDGDWGLVAGWIHMGYVETYDASVPRPEPEPEIEPEPTFETNGDPTNLINGMLGVKFVRVKDGERAAVHVASGLNVNKRPIVEINTGYRFAAGKVLMVYHQTAETDGRTKWYQPIVETGDYFVIDGQPGYIRKSDVIEVVG